jgi:hypothetical protein
MQVGYTGYIAAEDIVCLAFDYGHVRIACTQTHSNGRSKPYAVSQVLNMYVEVYSSTESFRTVPQLKVCRPERHNLYRRTIVGLYREHFLCLCPWSQWSYKSKWYV